MQNYKKCTGFIADLYIGRWVELTFIEGKLGRFLMLTFL